MSLDLEKLGKKFDEILNSEETKEYFRELKIKKEVLKKRCERVEKYLEGKNFAEIMERLRKEHDETYQDKCYKKGFMPYPNNKFDLLMSYLEENYSHIEKQEIPQDFLSACYFFKGYYFTIYCGQGCFYRVYDNNLNHYLQI